MLISGREIADKILSELKVRVQKLRKKGINPTLAIILVGDSPESKSYVEQKELKGNKIGIKTTVKRLSSNVSEAELLRTIEQLNNDKNIHGIIVQRPVKGINSKVLNEVVLPEKDVDGFNSKSEFDYPIANAVLTILEHIFSSKRKVSQFVDFLRRAKIVLIGKGETGGSPIAKTLNKMGINYSIIDSKTRSPELITRNADIIISAVGKPNVIKPKMLKKHIILISVGLSKNSDGKLHGDYNEDEIKNIASFYTSTPGGVGPVNVAMLLKNLVTAAER